VPHGKEGVRHKTSGEKDRVILSTGETLENVKRLVQLHPTCPLFRRPNGKPFTREFVVDRFIKLRKRLGMPRH
jgi:hypothetical protein